MSLLTIVIPCYNEEENIPVFFPELLKFAKEHDFKVIAVNDGSKDATAQELEKFSGEECLQVLTHKCNRGYGGAIKSGLHAVKTEYAITIDSDGQHRLEDVLACLEKIQQSNADMVVCDGNLSKETIARLTEVCLAPLYLDPVSTTWAKEIAPYIGYFDTVKPNRMELAALTGVRTDSIAGVMQACDILFRKGVRRVFVSLGREGMIYRGREGTVHRIARPFPDVVDVTSAGEAAMAGIVWGSRQGMTADEIVCTAMAAGMIAISSPDTISADMSAEKIEEMIRDYIL